MRPPSKETSQEILHGVSIGDVRPQATLCGVYLENITGTELEQKNITLIRTAYDRLDFSLVLL